MMKKIYVFNVFNYFIQFINVKKFLNIDLFYRPEEPLGLTWRDRFQGPENSFQCPDPVDHLPL